MISIARYVLWSTRRGTYRTKLKLDKEVGGGFYCEEVFQKVFQHVFQDIIREVFQDVFQTVFQKVFQDVFQEIIREVFQEVFKRYFGRLNSWKNPYAKVVDFVPLGALFGPRAPEADLAHFQIRL